MPRYTANLVPHLWPISSDTVSDGNYDFNVGDVYDPLPFFLDGFHFVDGSGALVTATAGTVTVAVSTDGVLYREIVDGTVSATSDPVSITPPSGSAPVVSVRISLTGVTGASGFRANFVKGE